MDFAPPAESDEAASMRGTKVRSTTAGEGLRAAAAAVEVKKVLAFDIGVDIDIDR